MNIKSFIFLTLVLFTVVSTGAFLGASNSDGPIDFDFEDCEDLTEIPQEFEVGDFIPIIPFPGYTIDTSCGEAILGCIVAPVSSPGSPETEYECVYVGPANNRCYLSQTTSYYE